MNEARVVFLEPGELPMYDRDPTMSVAMIGEDGRNPEKTPDHYMGRSRFIVPMFDIVRSGECEFSVEVVNEMIKEVWAEIFRRVNMLGRGEKTISFRAAPQLSINPVTKHVAVFAVVGIHCIPAEEEVDECAAAT
jgi:hypothetical protein